MRCASTRASPRTAPARGRCAPPGWPTACLVSAGQSHACGVQTDHSLWCLGDNGNGQLGVVLPARREVKPA
ncbi:hypothetical protein [Actinoplanes philippinensis]|uniref:hypothetical protein n=1 Tax=Actinoplanes philippinensis TaxID=35752 RepID=UPI003F4D3C6C